MIQTRNNNIDHPHQNSQQIQTEQKVQESSKHGVMTSETGSQIEKIEILK